MREEGKEETKQRKRRQKKKTGLFYSFFEVKFSHNRTMV
jgi:hypothetical protein